MGAEVVPVESGGRTLKDAINEALRDWTASFADTHYLLGTVAGPHPFPTMVREFQRVIGREARAQILAEEGRLPDAVIACVGGGSNAIGMFADFIDDEDVRLIGVEAAGKGLDGGEHGATLLRGRPGILHGAETYVLQDEDGQIADSWSVSAGLDYPAVGPEHAFLKDSGRAEYVGATDEEALGAFALLARSRRDRLRLRIRPCAGACAEAGRARPEAILVVNLSGPRRQGHGAGAAPAGARRDEPLRRDVRAAAARGEGAFGAFVMLGDPDLDDQRGDPRRAGRGRRRHDRGRHPLLRSDRRRAGDPGGGRRGRWRPGVDAGRLLRPARRFPRAPSRRCRSASSPTPISSSRAAATLSTRARREAGRRQRAGRRRAAARGRALRRRGAGARRRAGADRRRQHAAARRLDARSRGWAAATPIASPAPA